MGSGKAAGHDPVASSTRFRISSICRRRTWVLRTRIRDARVNASFPRPRVPAILRLGRAQGFGDERRGKHLILDEFMESHV
jgi:hypothetical protein